MPSAGLDPRLIVLGAGAGGGSPQWNCRCKICEKVRSGARGTEPRTQTSLALSADGQRYVLINASPDIGRQIAQTPALHPRQGRRHSPIAAVVLTGAEIDQITGLLTLREGSPLALYASTAVHQTLEQSTVFGALNKQIVPRRRLPMDASVALSDAADNPLGITIRPFAVPGKIPLYEETQGAEPALDLVSEHTVALEITLAGRRLFFIPCCAAVTPRLAERVRGAWLIFFDGTLFRDDEMVTAGLSQKTGRRMGHMSISGPDGILEVFAGLEVERKIFIHINNSNPILLADSAERAQVERAGWEVAWDQMEISW